MLKRSCLVASSFVLLGASTNSWADEGREQAGGFIQDSSLNVLLRNYYLNRDFRTGNNGRGSSPNGYREEWAQGFIANFSSGFTPGLIGLGIDAHAYLGLKLDSGKGRTGTGLLPIDSQGRAEDDYSEAGAAIKARVSKTELRYGSVSPNVPVAFVNGTRLLPQTVNGFMLTSKEVKDLTVDGGYFTSGSSGSSTNQRGEIKAFYANREVKSAGYGGLTWNSDPVSASFYAINMRDFWNQYYGNFKRSWKINEASTFFTELSGYYTEAAGKKIAGDVDGLIYSFAAGYAYKGHRITLGWQENTANTPYDYLGMDDNLQTTSIYLNNVTNFYAEFNGPNERSKQIRYEYNFVAMGLPGMTFLARYTNGWGVDGTHVERSSPYFGKWGDSGKHWESDLELRYVVQSGKAKGLTTRLRHATHRANSDQFERDLDETRLIVEFPIKIF
ncbi:OprD family porin [Pseudomonas sp. TYF_14]|uniref:OprD family porin n=1 Tax=Pseudomonas sp. TYF_14 TaxID=3367193 RepID=UPI00370B2AE3